MVDMTSLPIHNPVELRPVVAVLEVALTPAFLLVALGSILNIFSTRLSRIVDRIRVLETAYPESEGEEHDRIVSELRTLEQRMTAVSRSILLGVLSAMAVAVMIVVLFVMGLSGKAVAMVVVALFTTALAMLVAALFLFVREVQLATGMLHVRQEYLEMPPRQTKFKKGTDKC